MNRPFLLLTCMVAQSLHAAHINIKQLSQLHTHFEAEVVPHYDYYVTFAHYKEAGDVLLKYPALINRRLKNGWTTLMWALYKEWSVDEFAKLLCIPGIDVNLTNIAGTTTLMMAADASQQEVGIEKKLELLLVCKANVWLKNIEGLTALHAATLKQTCLHTGGVIEKDKRVVDALLKAGADINAQTNLGLTPVMLAALTGYHEMVKYLLSYGAKTDICCHPSGKFQGKTVYDFVDGNAKVSQAIQEGLADYEAQQKNSRKKEPTDSQKIPQSQNSSESES